jgi:anti-sigma regulatory factor (Ser/Thr protein kinase)
VDARRTSIAITNDVAEITRVAAFIEAFCSEQGAAPEVIFKINLAVEEALVNTISYGYADRSQHAITIEITADSEAIILVLTDDGAAYNPLEAPPPDVDAPADARKSGGLGVFLVKQMMDEVSYAREGEQNRLTLLKRLAQEKP